MRKFVLALAALAAFGLAIPAVSSPAEAAKKVVIIKKKRHHHHWRGHRHGHRDHHRHGATIVVR